MDKENKNTEHIKWYRPPLEKEVLARLKQRSDLRGFWEVLSRLIFSGATGALAVYAWFNLPWQWTLLAVYVHGMFFTFLSEHAAVHELAHGTVFKSRFWNNFFFRLLAFMTWSSSVKFRASHTQHHMVTCYADRDLEVVIPYKLTALHWIGYATIDFAWINRTMLTTIRHALGIIQGTWEQRLFPLSDAKARRELFMGARFTVVGHLVLAAVFVYFKLWLLLVLFTFGSLYATLLAWLCAHLQHLGMQPSVPDFRLCTRSVEVNPFIAFLHWNMDYHIEHHMYASVPFYNLPALSKEIKGYLPEPKSIWRTWSEDLLPTLKRQKMDPNYVSRPALPECDP